jgi:PST family polysaccharide transporter
MWNVPDLRVLFKNLASLSTIQFSNFLFSFIVVLYTVRIIGAEKFGVLALAQVTVQYFAIFVNYGFTVSSTKEVSFHRHDRQIVSTLFSGTLIIKTLFAAISLLLITTAALSIPPIRAEFYAYFFTALTLIGEAINPLWLFQGVEKAGTLLKTTLVTRLVAALLVVWLVRKPDDYLLIPLLTSAGNIVVGALALWLGFSILGVRLVRVPLARLLAMARVSTGFFLSRAAVTLYTTVNTFFIGIVLGSLSAGLFAAADKVIRILPDTFYPLYIALFAYFNQPLPAEIRPSRIRFYRWCFSASLLVILAIATILFIFAGPVVRLLFGPEFSTSATLLRWMVVVPALYHISSMIGGSILIPNGFQRVYNSSIIIAALAHLGFLGLLYLGGIVTLTTVAIAAIFVETVVMSLRLYVILKEAPMRRWLLGDPRSEAGRS